MKAALFPGQGIEAKVVHAALDAREPHLARASEILGYDLARRVEQATRRPRGVLPTAVAQPAIFVAGYAAYREALARGERFDALLGHSLGEYTALAAGEAFTFEQGLRLVAARAAAMQAAGSDASGGMAAVLGLDLATVESVAASVGLTVANDNTPGQVVLAGTTERLAQGARNVAAEGGRCVLLPVEGAYHSAAMGPACEALAEALTNTHVRSPAIPVVSNVTARPYGSPGEIRRVLVQQLTGRVRFRECVAFLAAAGVEEMVDLGPGEVVGRLARANRSPRREPVRA